MSAVSNDGSADVEYGHEADGSDGRSNRNAPLDADTTEQRLTNALGQMNLNSTERSDEELAAMRMQQANEGAGVSSSSNAIRSASRLTTHGSTDMQRVTSAAPVHGAHSLFAPPRNFTVPEVKGTDLRQRRLTVDATCS